jgi:prepilin signal peptidase PulO-like enzyme (type II secretory pathway)
MITLPLLLSGLVLSAFGFGPPMLASVAGAIIGYVSLASIAFGYRLLRGHDGLGLGDAKLLAMLGAWIGVALLPQVLLIAALLGLACYAATRAFGGQLRANDALPFGPFLAISGYCVLLSTREPSIVTDVFQLVAQLS